MAMKSTQQGMKERERLSALMDDSLDDWQARRALGELRDSQSCREVWHHYHANQAALHQAPQVDVLAGVNAALDADEEAERQAARLRRSRWTGFAQGALAAGVCLVAVLALWPLSTQDSAAPSEPVLVQLPQSGPGEASTMDNYWSRHAHFATHRGSGQQQEPTL